MTPQDQLRPQDDTVDLDSAVDQLRQKFRVPKVLVDRMVTQESGGNTKAVSPVGARGRFQVMPGTIEQISRETGKRLDNNNPLDNAYAGLYLLNQNYNKFRQGAPSERGAWMRAVAAYHAGAGNVQKDLQSGGLGVPDVGDGLINTRDHVYAIFNGTKSEEFGDEPQSAEKAVSMVPGMGGLRLRPRQQPTARPVRRPWGKGAIGQGVETAPISADRTAGRMAGANVSGTGRTQSQVLKNRYGSAADPFGVVPPDPDVEAAKKAEAQKEYTRLLTANADEVARVKEKARKEIQGQGGWTPNVDKWLAETVSRGESHFNELLAGGARPFSDKGFNRLWSRAEGIRQAVEEESKGRSEASKWAQGTLAGLVSPEMAATMLHVPPEVAFGGGAGLSTLGRGGTPTEAAQATRIGATEGALFRGPAVGSNVATRTLTKAGTVGAGTYALTGDPVSAASNAVFAGAGPLLHGEGARPRPEIAEAIPASKAREFAPTLAPSELAKRTALREGTYEGRMGITEEGIPKASVEVPEGVSNVKTGRVSARTAEPVGTEPAAVETPRIQNRRVRNVVTGTKGQFKKGFKPEEATPPESAETAIKPAEVLPPEAAVAAASTPAIQLKPRKPGQRSFPESVKGAGYAAESSKYDVKPNVDTVAKADETIKTKGLDKAVADLTTRKEGQEFTPEDVAVGIRAIQKHSASGDIQKSIDVTEVLAEKLQKAGQTVQAASLIARLSPEGTLLYAQRQLPKGVKLKPEQGANLVSTSKRVVESETKVTNLTERIAKMKPEKIGTLEDRLLKMETDARARLAARVESGGVKGSQAGASTIPLDIADYAIIGAAKLARKGVSLASWTNEMVKEFGEDIRPHLNKIYRNSYALYDKEKTQFGQERKERGARKAGATDKTLQEVINQQTEAQKQAQKARRELQSTYDQLSRAKLQKAAQGTTGLRRANLLTAARALIRNIPSNALHMASEGVSRPVAAMADMIASRTKGTGIRTTTGTSIPAEVKATYNAILKEGPRRAADIILGREVLPLEGYGKGGESLGSKMQMEKSDTGIKLLDFYIDKVFAAQGAVDAPAKIYAFTRELSDIAKSIALTEKRTDKTVNVTNRTKELRANPTDAMLMEASAYADFATFQNDNTVSRGIRGMKRAIGTVPTFAIEQIAPFDRTPTNILYRTIENSPLGFISAANKYRNIGNVKGRELSGQKTPRAKAKYSNAIADAAFTRAEQKEFARTFGRASTGTILSALAVSLAAKGLLIGSSDYDDDKAAYFRKRHNYGGGAMLKVPYTNQYIYIGDTPAGKSMATVASMYEQISDEKKDTGEKVTGAAKSVGRLALDQPLLQGTRDLFTGKSVYESSGQYLSTLVPGSAALKQVGEITDPEARKSYGEGFGAQLKITSPYHRRELPVNEGVDKGERGGTKRRVLRSLDPFNSTTEGRGPITLKPRTKSNRKALRF